MSSSAPLFPNGDALLCVLVYIQPRWRSFCGSYDVAFSMAGHDVHRHGQSATYTGKISTLLVYSKPTKVAYVWRISCRRKCTFMGIRPLCISYTHDCRQFADFWMGYVILSQQLERVRLRKFGCVFQRSILQSRLFTGKHLLLLLRILYRS